MRTPGTALAFHVLLLCQLVCADNANWKAGFNSNEENWFLKHPLWASIQNQFQHRSDSIAETMRAQIPAKLDTIMVLDTVVRIDSLGNKTKWASQYRNANLYPVLVMRPVLVRSKPDAQASPVAVLLPSGSWRAWREFAPVGTTALEETKNMPSGPDTITAMLPVPHPDVFVLLADSLGKNVGWAPWDSLSLFPSLYEANAAIPFFQQGFADYIDGIYLAPPRTFPKNPEKKVSRTNPLTCAGPNIIYRMDMHRLLFQVTGDYSQASEDSLQSYSSVNMNKTWYLDPIKVQKMSSIPLHLFWHRCFTAPLTPTFTSYVSEVVSGNSMDPIEISWNINRLYVSGWNLGSGGDFIALVRKLPLDPKAPWLLRDSPKVNIPLTP